MIPTSSISAPSFGQTLYWLLFTAWASSFSHHRTPEAVLPLTVLITTNLFFLTQTRVIQSDHPCFDMDHPRQSLGYLDLYNRCNTYFSRIDKRHSSGIDPSPRPDYLVWNSMTETALRWSELLDASSIAGAEYYSLRQKEIECPQLHSIGNIAVETTQSDHYWKYSGRWFTIAMGYQKRPISRTYTPDSQIASLVTSDLSTIISDIFEETEQQSPVDSLEQSLISKQKHGIRREGNTQKLFREHTKQKLRFESTKKFPHLTWGKNRDFQTSSFLKRTKMILRKFVVPRKNCGSAVDSITSTTVTAQQNDSHDRCSSRQGSYGSADSSCDKHNLGQQSLGTLHSRQRYMSTNSKQYCHVDLGNRNAPIFLPSKILSINIPLLSSTNLTDKDCLRSCLFDLSAPGSLGSPPLRLKTQRIKPSVDVRSTTASSDPAWFRVRVEGSEDPSSSDEFDQKIPDHLPSSPLCPRHHKHSSGGTGDCMMHGRNRKKDTSA